ncbi:Outer-membrane lipoprotein carrier protein [compost metagenome]
MQWLSLTPKRDTQASFDVAALGFSGGALSRMELTDAVGQRTIINFSGWKKNPSFAAGTFRFVPGKDVDVVGER